MVKLISKVLFIFFYYINRHIFLDIEYIEYLWNFIFLKQLKQLKQLKYFNNIFNDLYNINNLYTLHTFHVNYTNYRKYNMFMENLNAQKFAE